MGGECKGVGSVEMVIRISAESANMAISPQLEHILYDILYDLKASNPMRLNLYYKYTIRLLRCYNKRKVFSLPFLFLRV